MYPITHNIENFSRWPTNLNDPLLKTPPRELCPSVSGSGLVELNTREFLGHTHNDIPRLRLPSRTYLVWSYMSCVPLAEHSEGKYNSLSVICITLRPHSFHFIQIEPTHGLTGVYSIVNSSFSNPLSQYVLYYHRRNKMSRENMQ